MQNQNPEHQLSKCTRCGAPPFQDCTDRLGRVSERVHHHRPMWSRQTAAWQRLYGPGSRRHADKPTPRRVATVKFVQFFATLPDEEKKALMDVLGRPMMQPEEEAWVPAVLRNPLLASETFGVQMLPRVSPELSQWQWTR